MRHPKKCKSFESLCNCRFVNWVLLHVESEANKKTEMLVKVVNDLKYKIKQIAQTLKDGNNLVIDRLEMEVKELKDEVRKMAENLRNSEMLWVHLNERDKKNVYSLKEKEKGASSVGRVTLNVKTKSCSTNTQTLNTMNKPSPAIDVIKCFRAMT